MCVLLVALIGSWVVVLTSLLIHHYLGRNWLESLVFRVNDGWCDNTKDGIGLHCFGDFGLGYFQGDFYNQFPLDYVPENFITTNTPMTILLFRVLELFGYDTAMGIYSALMLSSIVFPLVHATRRMDPVYRAVIVVFGGLLAHGTIATLDRGNHIGLLVTPAYLYILSLKEGRKKATIGWLVVLTTLKFWGGLFVLPLLVDRRLKELFKTITLTAEGYLIPLAMFDGRFADALRTMIKVNSSNEISNITGPYNISGNGLVQRIVCAARRRHFCNTTDPSNQYSLEGIVSVIVVVVLVGLVILLLIGFRDYPLIRYGSLLAIPQFVIPDAALYSTVFSTCLLAVIVFCTGDDQIEFGQFSRRHRTVTFFLYSVVVATLTPIALSVTTLSWLGSSNGTANPEFKIQYWVNPMLWTLYFGTAGYAAIRKLAAGRQHTPTHQTESEAVLPSDNRL